MWIHVPPIVSLQNNVSHLSFHGSLISLASPLLGARKLTGDFCFFIFFVGI